MMRLPLPFPRTKKGWLRLLAVLLLLGLIGGGVYLIVVDRLGEHYFRQAQQAEAEYKYEEADKAIERSLRLKPRHAEAHLLAARLCRRWGREEQAAEHLELCKKQLHGTTVAVELETLMQRAGRGELGDVVPYLQPYFVTDRPEAPLVLEALSGAFLRAFDFGQASKLIEEWTKRQPDNPWAWLQKGRLLAMRSQASDAIEAFEKGVEVAPWCRDLRFALGEQLLNASRSKLALPHLKWVCDHFPEDLLALNLLTRCYRDLGRLEEAQRSLEVLLHQAPDSASAQFERGMIALERDQTEKAVEVFHEVLTLDKSFAAAHYQLARCYRQLKRPQAAAEHEKRFLALDKDFERITRIMQQDLALNPRNTEAYFELGQLRLRLGNTNGAIEAFKRVLVLDPGHRGAHQALADYYTKQQDIDHAAFHLQRAKRRDETQPRPQ